MRNKKAILFTGGLVIVATATLLVDKIKRGGSDPLVGTYLLKADDMPAVDSIKLSKGSETTELLKNQSADWEVASGEKFPADAAKIVRFLDQLSKTKFQTRVTLGSTSLSEFGFDAATKIEVKKKADTLLDLNLGDQRAGGGQYVMLKEKDVYVTDQGISAHLGQEEWENKVIVDIGKTEIQKVTFFDAQRRKAAEVSRDKQEDKLTLAGGSGKGKALLDAIDGVETILEKVQFTKKLSVDNEEAKTAMLKPTVVKVQLFDQREFDVSVGQVGEKDKEKYFFRITSSKEDPYLKELMEKWSFEIPAHVAKRFRKTNKDFLDQKGA